MSLLHDLISMRSRRHRLPDPVHSLVQERRGVVAWRLERPTRALQMPERQPLLTTAPRLIARQTLALLTTGETLVSAVRTMRRSTITTVSGMTVDGGEISTHESCLDSAGGGTGTPATGIQRGVTTRTLTIRTMGPFTATATWR